MRMPVACVAAVLMLASVISGLHTVPASAQPRVLYDPDPKHLWNRVHEVFRVRVAADGSVHGFDTVDPLLWRETRHLLSGPSHTAALGILDEFLSSKGETLSVDPLERAVFQHDLWAVFDWLAVASDGENAARSRLMTRLVRVMRRVALGRAQIEALPDTYAAALASGRLALPPDLFSAGGTWVGVGGSQPVAPQHAAELGRSAFGVHWSLPGGRAATERFLRTLWDFPQPSVADHSFQMARDGELRVMLNPALPSPPEGTRLALVRRMLVIDGRGVILPTNIVQTIQFRVLGKDQAFSEFTMSRAGLFAGPSGGLRAVTAEETGFLTFSSHGLDAFERQEVARSPSGARVLDGCATCHQTEFGPVLESIRSLRSVLRPNALVDPGHPRWSQWSTQANAACYAKSRTYEWGVLQGLWHTQPR